MLFFRRMRREDASLMVISRCWYRSQRHETDVLGRKDQSASFQNSATPLVCLNSLTEIVLVTVVVLFIVLTLWIADRKDSWLVKRHTVAILIVVLCCQIIKWDLCKSGPPPTSNFECQICHPMCRSRIGLLAHNKTHLWWWDSSRQQLSPCPMKTCGFQCS